MNEEKEVKTEAVAEPAPAPAVAPAPVNVEPIPAPAVAPAPAPAAVKTEPAPAPAPLFSAPQEPRKRALVVGLGGAGSKTLDALAKMPEAAWLELLAIDTDRESLEACSASKRLRAASEWRVEAGCGGDVIKGERSLSHERARIGQLLEGVSLVIVTGGLGGGTATGGVRILASIAKSAGVPSVFLLSMPFTFESHGRRKAAEDCIAELLPMVDLLLCLPNDLLFSTLASNTPVEEAFKKSCEELAGTVFGLAEMLRCRNLMSADFATFMSVLHEKKATCGLGIGRANADEGLNRCHLAIERMLASPFLGGVSKLENADTVVIGISGGPDLEIGEMKKALETASSLTCGNAELIVGANSSPLLAGRVQLTALAIKYDRLPEKPIAIREPSDHWVSGERGLKQTATAAQEKLEQGLLELQSYNKGIFSNVAPAKYKDEDLDIPTFQRRNVAIDKGDVGR